MVSRLFIRALACALLLSGCATAGGIRVDKFQVLAPARLVGEVVAVRGTDFDLRLNAPLGPLGSLVHCESYGYRGLREEPGAVLQLGQRVAVSGWLVLDNACHPDDSAGRLVRRGLLRACRPKLELHPYWSSTVTPIRAPALAVRPEGGSVAVHPASEEKPAADPRSGARLVRVGFWAEVYLGDGRWLANDLAQVAGAPVPDSWTVLELEVSPP